MSLFVSEVSATPKIVVIDPDLGQVNAPTTIEYKKLGYDELWARSSGAAWVKQNVHVLTGLGDVADTVGSYVETLSPGGTYEAAVFAVGHGPTSSDPVVLADVVAFGLLKKPHETKLILDQNFDFGGTWCFHQVVTRKPTNLVSLEVSRTRPRIDPDGVPHAVHPDGTTSPTPIGETNHRHQTVGLYPGNEYFSSIVVADDRGNWEVLRRTFTTLRRQLLVAFPGLTVENDGDPFAEGEGEFWFRVYNGPKEKPVVIEEFHQSTMDIDDWSEKGRPYGLGFAHVGAPKIVTPETNQVAVGSWATEHDGFFEADEHAASHHDGIIPLPVGPQVEKASGALTINCPTSSAGDDFRYRVDVTWTVSYVP